MSGIPGQQCQSKMYTAQGDLVCLNIDSKGNTVERFTQSLSPQQMKAQQDALSKQIAALAQKVQSAAIASPTQKPTSQLQEPFKQKSKRGHT